MLKLSLITCLLIVLTGCGQTGPLYLPDHPPAKSTNTGQ